MPTEADDLLRIEHFKFVSSQIPVITSRMVEAFNFYASTFSAIVGGSIWLRIQDTPTEIESNFALLSNVLVILLAFLTVLRIVENVRSWRGYRLALKKIYDQVPDPKTLVAMRNEIAMTLGVISSASLFVYFNPFYGSHA